MKFPFVSARRYVAMTRAYQDEYARADRLAESEAKLHARVASLIAENVDLKAKLVPKKAIRERK